MIKGRKLLSTTSLVRASFLATVIAASTIAYADESPAKELAAEDYYYSPVVEWGGKFSKGRKLTELNYMQPIFAKNDHLPMIDLKLKLDNYKSREINLGLAYRYNYDENFILGAYGYFDHRTTGNNFGVKGITVGAEFLSNYVDARANFYLPEASKKKIKHNNKKKIEIQGTSIFAVSGGHRYEYPMKGYDVEVGAPIFAFSPELNERFGTRVFAAKYEFTNKHTKNISGLRFRFEHNLAQTWIGNNNLEFKLTGETQYDNVRKRQNFIGVSARLTFDDKKNSKNRSKGSLKNRMMSTIVRDVDIVTTDANESPTISSFKMNGREVKKIHYVGEADGTYQGNGTQASPLSIEQLEGMDTSDAIIVVTSIDKSKGGKKISKANYKKLMAKDEVVNGKEEVLLTASKGEDMVQLKVTGKNGVSIVAEDQENTDVVVNGVELPKTEIETKKKVAGGITETKTKEKAIKLLSPEIEEETVKELEEIEHEVAVEEGREQPIQNIPAGEEYEQEVARREEQQQQRDQEEDRRERAQAAEQQAAPAAAIAGENVQEEVVNFDVAGANGAADNIDAGVDTAPDLSAVEQAQRTASIEAALQAILAQHANTDEDAGINVAGLDTEDKEMYALILSMAGLSTNDPTNEYVVREKLYTKLAKHIKNHPGDNVLTIQNWIEGNVKFNDKEHYKTVARFLKTYNGRIDVQNEQAQYGVQGGIGASHKTLRDKTSVLALDKLRQEYGVLDAYEARRLMKKIIIHTIREKVPGYANKSDAQIKQYAMSSVNRDVSDQYRQAVVAFLDNVDARTGETIQQRDARRARLNAARRTINDIVEKDDSAINVYLAAYRAIKRHTHKPNIHGMVDKHFFTENIMGRFNSFETLAYTMKANLDTGQVRKALQNSGIQNITAEMIFKRQKENLENIVKNLGKSQRAYNVDSHVQAVDAAGVTHVLPVIDPNQQPPLVQGRLADGESCTHGVCSRVLDALVGNHDQVFIKDGNPQDFIRELENNMQQNFNALAPADQLSVRNFVTQPDAQGYKNEVDEVRYDAHGYPTITWAKFHPGTGMQGANVNAPVPYMNMINSSLREVNQTYNYTNPNPVYRIIDRQILTPSIEAITALKITGINR